MVAAETPRSAALEAFLAEVAGALPGVTMRQPSVDSSGVDIAYSVLCEYEKYVLRVARVGTGTWESGDFVHDISWWADGSNGATLAAALGAYHDKLAALAESARLKHLVFRRMHTPDRRAPSA